MASDLRRGLVGTVWIGVCCVPWALAAGRDEGGSSPSLPSLVVETGRALPLLVALVALAISNQGSGESAFRRRAILALCSVSFSGLAWSAASLAGLYCSGRLGEMTPLSEATAPFLGVFVAGLYCLRWPSQRVPVLEACAGLLSAWAGVWMRTRSSLPAGLEVYYASLVVAGTMVLASPAVWRAVRRVRARGWPKIQRLRDSRETKLKR